MSARLLFLTGAVSAAAFVNGDARAEDLFRPGAWVAMSADLKAMQAGDLLTVMIYQTAESSQTAKTNSARSTDLNGGLEAGSIKESGTLRFGGGYSGGGQVQRSERLVTQITVTIEQVLPNGDLRISGRQRMHVNGETSDIGVRGRVRKVDITGDNRVLSSRIADAQIDYDGRGFVSRSAKPGIVNRLFRLLGLG